jgi:hypothetical protein
MERPATVGDGDRARPLVRMAGITAFLLIGMVLFSGNAMGQRGPRHAIGAEYAGMVFYGSTSVHYELITSDHLSFRFGVGSAYATIIIADVEATGGTAMVNFMTRGLHKFEAGFGVSVMHANFSFLFEEERLPLATRVYPALSVGYRSMPRGRGFFWRVGAAWMYGYGLPLLLGAGYVF